MNARFPLLLALAVGLTLVAGFGLAHYFHHDIEHQSHLTNASCRTYVSGNPHRTAIFCFTVSEQRQLTLIRIAGPRLARAGIAEVLPHPSLRVLRNADGADLTRDYNPNNPYMNLATVKTYAEEAMIPEEKPLVMLLEGGTYSLLLESADGNSGEALVEITAIPL